MSERSHASESGDAVNFQHGQSRSAKPNPTRHGSRQTEAGTCMVLKRRSSETVPAFTWLMPSCKPHPTRHGAPRFSTNRGRVQGFERRRARENVPVANFQRGQSPSAKPNPTRHGSMVLNASTVLRSCRQERCCPIPHGINLAQKRSILQGMAPWFWHGAGARTLLSKDSIFCVPEPPRYSAMKRRRNENGPAHTEPTTIKAMGMTAEKLSRAIS